MTKSKPSFFSAASEYLKESDKKLWEGTLEQYIEMVLAKPSLNVTAHQRVLNMIESHGVQTMPDGSIKYAFFDNELFGVEDSIDQFMAYMKAAASGSEVSRRILLMYGPTSSGKSQLAILLKRGLEKYSKTDDGAVYCLADSPMWEDPLWAVPQELRPELAACGIKITGELSPLTELILKEKYEGNFMKMPVKRYFFSEKNRASVGTFVPSNPKNQDLSELVGSIDLSTVGQYGAESDPRAYRFDGELNVANRGIMEFVEMLKVDQKFLYVLLTLAQEKNIKTGRFPLIYADEFLLAHSNEWEFKKFLGKEEMEALHDRTITIKVPYNLTVNNEVKIYEKLINQANFNGVHIAPHTLRCAAMFAVLSRLKSSSNHGLSAQNKMKLYNGEDVDGFTQAEVKKFKAEFHDEGMDGLSPRYIINRLSAVLAEGSKSVTPIEVLRSLRDGLISNPKVDKKESERLESILTSVLEEYNQLARNDVQKAFFVNFEAEISNLLTNYLEHIEAYLDGVKVDDEWGNQTEPDERLMKSIEEKINVSESGKRSFRTEILRKMLKSSKDNGGVPNYKEHARLREALEKKLFEERQDVIRLTVSARNPDEESIKRTNVVIATLIDKHGYNADSANQLLKYVNSLMGR